MTMKTARVLGIVTPLVLGMLTSRNGRADGVPPTLAPVGKSACLDAVQKGQTLRDAHKLVEARDQFRVCARAECPDVVKGDCTTWVGELDKAVPTVVLAAKDGAGKDALDVTVSADGRPIASTLDGEAVAVDPGMRTFRFVRADGSTATEQVLVKEGDKLKTVAVVLSPGPPPVSAPAPAPTPVPSPGAPMSTQRLVAYVVGGAGIVMAGVGIGVGVAAKSEDSAAKNETGLQQYNDSKSAVNEGTAASVVLGVGAAVAAAGVVLWLTAPKAVVGVGTTGREVYLRGSF